jgi:6-phosphofructokinase 2
MASIVTITFNPCIDKSTSISGLIPEKKLVCSVAKLEPGGGGINVARAIKKLGGNATAVFPYGGCTGKVFKTLLQNEGIETITIETNAETRENIIVVDEATNNQYRFGMAGVFLEDAEWQLCLRKVADLNDIDFIVASGSLPSNVPATIYALLAKIAKDKNAKFIVVTSGDALFKAINQGVYLVKPNAGELAFLAGKKGILRLDEIKQISTELITSKKSEVVVVSLGAEGAMLVTSDTAEIVKPPSVIRKSTVGAGDSMVAGIVFSLAQNKSILEAIQFGVACGTAATMNSGTELCKKEDAERIWKQLQFERMQNLTHKNY